MWDEFDSACRACRAEVSGLYCGMAIDSIPRRVLFLDFDGVLHPEDSRQTGMFVHMDAFANVVRAHLDTVDIVISSSWRESFAFVQLLEFFPEDIQDNVVGMTPVFEKSCANGMRGKEIAAYCKRHGLEDADILVLDDSRAMFDAGDAARVRWVNPQTGLTTEDLEHIGAFFSGARHAGCTHTDNSFCM